MSETLALAKKNGQQKSPPPALKSVPASVAKQLLADAGYEVFEPKEISSEVEVRDDVKRIIIPKGMSKLDAAHELELQYENEEEEIDVDSEFTGWNYADVLVAIRVVTEDYFGWVKGIPIRGFFSNINPTYIDIVTDIRNGKQVIEKAFYGRFGISAFENAACTIQVKRAVVSMSTECKKKYSQEVTEYYNRIREYLRNNSIYRGKCIVVTANPQFENTPQFEIIENKPSKHIVLNHDENVLMNQFVYPGLNDSGKRCYLFTGPYGNGKTETAMKVGKYAIENGLSFFYLKNAELFDLVIAQLSRYQPAVLFVEDIDEIASGETRDARMNKILNTLDGVQTKGNNLTVILTTNHEDRINTALRRPGRIDLVIKFKNPEEETKRLIFISYLEEMNGADSIDYGYVSKKCPDVPGAVIAEICKRVEKRYKQTKKVDTELIEACILSMGEQISLMEKDPESKKLSPADAFVNFIVDKMAERADND